MVRRNETREATGRMTRLWLVVMNREGGRHQEAAATSDAVRSVRSPVPVIAAVFLHRHATSDHTLFYAQANVKYQSNGLANRKVF